MTKYIVSTTAALFVAVGCDPHEEPEGARGLELVGHIMSEQEAAQYALLHEDFDLDEYRSLLDPDNNDDLPIGSAEEPVEAVCPLEVLEPCIAPVATCAVRCCDDALFKSVQVCGYCGSWATEVCANHDTRKRVRWEW